MMAILLSRNINCDKEKGTDTFWSVEVEPMRMADAVDILNTYGLPRNQFKGIGDIFQKTGLVSSPTEERIRFMYGLSQDVAEMLSQIDGVLTARVNIVLPNNDPLLEEMVPSSAAVFIKFRRGSGVDGLAPQIKRLVTSSIEGLEYEKVSLVFLQSAMDEILSLQPNERESITQGASLRLWLIAGMAVLLLLIVLGTIGYFYFQSKNSKEAAPSSTTEEETS